MRLQSHLSVLALVFATVRAAPEAYAEPDAKPEAQSYNNYQPFSGAIYLVNPNGEPAAGSCPASASLSCGDQGHPSWCCPGGCSCVQQQSQNGYIGCCPAGQTCGGAVSVQTVTVTAQAQQTDAVVVPLVYTTTTQYTPYTAPAGAGAYCQTLTMKGPDLPRVTQGQCGTILIVSESSRNWKPIGCSVLGAFLLVQASFMRMFRWI